MYCTKPTYPGCAVIIEWNLPEILLLFPSTDEDVEYSKVFKIFENLSEGNLDLIDQVGEDNLLELLMKFGFGHS